MDCSLFDLDEALCLVAPPSSNNLGCGWCNDKCVELKCEWGIFSGYDNSLCDDGIILSTSSNGTHVCAGAITMTFALALIELILLLIIIITILSFHCKYMTHFINTACNPTKNYRKKFSNILSIFHYIVALIFGTVTLLFSFISLQSESDSSVVTWPYMVLLIVWCDIGGLMDLIPYWILPYNNINTTTHLHVQTKRNRSVLFKIIGFITYLLIFFLTVYAANIFHRYQSTLLITSIVWCLFLYVILPLPTTYSFWIQNMLNQSASIKQLLRAQRKYLKRLRKEKQKRKRQQHEDNEEMMSQTDTIHTNTNSSRLNAVTPQFQGQKGNEEFTFTPSVNNKFLLNNRQYRSNSDPSSSNNRKWSFSNNQKQQNDLLWFQLSSADMNHQKAAKMTFSTTEHNHNYDDKQQQRQHYRAKRLSKSKKNKVNRISPYKKRKKLGIRVSQIYQQRNGNYPANIRIDPYRRGFYFFLWILALSVNIISYFDYKHSIFWDGVLIMFICIIFKRFDHLLIVVINPLYRKCCAAKKRKQHQIQCKRLQSGRDDSYHHDNNNNNNNNNNNDNNIVIDKNDIELDIKPKLPNIDDRNNVNKSELKEPLIAKDGINAQNNTIAPQIEILREAKEDEDDSDSDSDDSSESADVYGPGSLAEGRVDEGYIGDRIFGVQMDFVSFAPETQQGVITGGTDMNTLGNLGTIYQSQPL